MDKLICGLGINDRKYMSFSAGTIIKEYNLWHSMLARCSEDLWNRYPTYSGTTCSENFKHYSYFYEWCHEQVGFGNKDEKGRSWCLDKDLLIKGNKVYSEETCVFVPQSINTILNKTCSKRGLHLLGVHFDKTTQKFVAQCYAEGKKKKIGRYTTEEQAFEAYKTFKEALIKEVAKDYKCQIDDRVYQALLLYCVDRED